MRGSGSASIICRSMDLTLPLDYAAIERILPHRYPFLLVDRITEFEVDKRIVGIKNVSLNERYLSHDGQRRAGAAADDPHRGGRAGRRDHDSGEAREPPAAALLRGHRARPLPPPGPSRRRRRDRSDVVRLRSRMGLLKGVARVDGKAVVDGTMTFALGPPQEAA